MKSLANQFETLTSLLAKNSTTDHTLLKPLFTIHMQGVFLYKTYFHAMI